MKSIIILQLISTLISTNLFQYSVSTECIPKGETCDEDCDCCGYKTNPSSVRCEIRHKPKGRRCYISGNIGKPCNDHDECKSQYCNPYGFCARVERDHTHVPSCKLKFKNVVQIDGKHADFPEECSEDCYVDERDGDFDVEHAVDGDLATIYANNRALTSGLLLYPEKHIVLRELNLCSAPDCPMCDPTCYKLEGYCSDTDTYELVQEGNIGFAARGECLTIPIESRSLHSHYKVTFPCQAAAPPTCEGPFPDVGQKDKGEEMCTCPSGLTPFVPKPRSLEMTCAGKHPTVFGPRLEYMGSSMNADGYTEIIYKMDHPAKVKDPLHFRYAILPWEGNCCFDCYKVYMDKVNSGGKGSGTGVLSHHDTPLTQQQCKTSQDLERLLFNTEDLELCMEGLKLTNAQVFGSHTFFFKVLVFGEIEMSMQPYRIALGDNAHMAYGDIMSPVCPRKCDGDDDKNDSGSSCKAYPMQIAEVGLTGKCNQLWMPKPKKYGKDE